MQKEQKEYALEYAGFWIRLGAGFIDLIILALIAGLLSCFHANLFLSLLLTFVVLITYYVGFLTWRGQTPGKMIVGIKVIRTDKNPLTLRDSVVRYCGYLVSLFSFCAGFIIIAFDKKKQGFHDKIADTYVVKLPVRQVILTPEPYARRGASFV